MSDAETLREYAREDPEAVRSIADKAGGKLGQALYRILEEEREQ